MKTAKIYFGVMVLLGGILWVFRFDYVNGVVPYRINRITGTTQMLLGTEWKTVGTSLYDNETLVAVLFFISLFAVIGWIRDLITHINTTRHP